MIIEIVKNNEDAVKCDELLTELVSNESQYDSNLKKDYIVKNYYENVYKNKNNILIVAKNEENVIIGYAYCKIITNDNGPTINHIAVLDGLYVDSKYRNQGIATKLIEECKKWSKQIGAGIFELKVISENETALELYKKIGFKEFEKKMRLKL